ncbi:ABC transporter substrate-binding protein [Pseudomonas sp. 2FG]|uniref:substrate-binding periplasmic protein n=1 Tax=Pseudomonas sp. 2FG TaxID=2502191 RepID=UPI0010F8A541|nr:transporter substrate-binding domain-containing protein [Pseudomonas sp. 2FG]
MKPMPRALLLSVLWLLTSGASAQTLRLVADVWPPFTDQSLPNGGLASDLVNTALTRAGYATEQVQVPWARALRGIEVGSYDVLVNAWFTEERTQLGQFSSPYLLNRVRLLKRKDSPIDFASLADLQPFNIAVVRGYGYGAEFDSASSLQKVPVLGFASAARMLHAGRVNLTLEDEFVARYYLDREPSSVRDDLEFLPKPLSENNLHILVSLQNPQHAQIVTAFNRALKAMKADGSYAALFKRHGL